MYELLIVTHILAGIAWVGAGLTEQLAVQQARRSGGAFAVDRQVMSLAWMERYIYVPAPILVVLTGLTMVAVSDAWRFSQPWVYIVLILVVFAGVLGGAVGGRLQKRIEELRETGQVESPEYLQTVSKALNTGWLELTVMVGIVFLMVYKPGA